MSNCYIIGGGTYDGFYDEILKDDLVIACDRGYKYASKEKIRIDYIIGDFDSSERPNFENTIVLNPIKDFTDTVAAIDFAIDKGYKNFILYGGLGGRESHTISNIKSAFAYKKQGIDIKIKSKKKLAFIVDRDFSYKFTGKNFYVSIFSLSEKSVLSIDGLFYELKDYVMANDDTLGVSNQTKGEDFKIGLKEGYLLVIFEDLDV